MKRFAGLCVISLMLFAVDQSVAQNSELFSGNGFGQNSGWGLGGPNPAALGSAKNTPNALGGSATKSNIGGEGGIGSFPKFKLPEFNFSKLKTPNWELPKLFQGNQFPDPIQISDAKQGLLANLPKMEDIFPARHPDRPSFFQRMNDRTKEIFGRTQSNIENLTRNAEATGRNTFDSITRGLNGDIDGSGNRVQPPIQPNLRTARETDGSTSRY